MLGPILFSVCLVEAQPYSCHGDDAMRPLRHLSERPELIVDERERSLYQELDATRVGRPGPFGRSRIVFALPTKGGPAELHPRRVVHDHDGFFLADPDGSLIGKEGVRVARMLGGRWTQDTRRFAG